MPDSTPLTADEANDLARVMFCGDKDLDTWHRVQARWYPEMGDDAGTPIYVVVAHVLRKCAGQKPAHDRAARVLRIVETPTDDEGNAISQAIFDAAGHLEGWAACRAIIALAEKEEMK